MAINLYTKDNCVQCKATKRALDRLNIEYNTIDIAKDDSARDYVLSKGFSQAPVVEAGDEIFSGFRPDRIKSLAAMSQTA